MQKKQMSEYEARTELIKAGFKICMQPIYRQMTILDAKYDDVKSFLNEQGYHGEFIVIGKAKVDKPRADAEYEQLSFF